MASSGLQPAKGIRLKELGNTGANDEVRNRERFLFSVHDSSSIIHYLDLTVIIPTKNRPAALERAVASVLRQNPPPRQLVIVDQSVTEESRERALRLVAASLSSAPVAIRLDYIRDPTLTGLTAARNRSLQVAHGDICLFLDDDVELECGFLAEILEVYARHPEVMGVSGVVANYPPPPPLYRLWRVLFFRGPFHDDRQLVYWNAHRSRGGEPVAVTRLGGGLMSFRKEAFRGLAFDEHMLDAGFGEDVDFCMRLPAGSLLMITPRARLIHHRSPAGRPAIHPLRDEAYAAHFLYRKHWDQGLKNRLSFAWINAGMALAATLASLRRRSLEPWRGLLAGTRDAHSADKGLS